MGRKRRIKKGKPIVLKPKIVYAGQDPNVRIRGTLLSETRWFYVVRKSDGNIEVYYKDVWERVR